MRDQARLPADLRRVETLTGSFGEYASVARALDGVRAVFLAYFDSLDQLAFQCLFVDTARRIGIDRIVRISKDHMEENRHLPLFGWHYDCERMLEAPGRPYVHLRPSWVMQNFLFVPSVTRGPDGRFRVPAGSRRAGFVDARDVAAVASVALTGGAQDGKALEMTEPELLSHGDLASMISAVTGRSIAYHDVTKVSYRRSLGELGIGEQTTDMMLTLFEPVRRGAYAALTDIVEV